MREYVCGGSVSVSVWLVCVRVCVGHAGVCVGVCRECGCVRVGARGQELNRLKVFYWNENHNRMKLFSFLE